MGKPIATNGNGICFAFPDVCWTPGPSGNIALPYPNIGFLSEAENVTTTVFAGGERLITSNSFIQKTTGDEAGFGGGTNNGGVKCERVKFTTYSLAVTAENGYVVRMSDSTSQNEGNAVGQVLGGNPTILVGD